jgi:antitoxin (DNA-binding transcriptional repressor) of toxin-antitoxin stability system
MKIEQKTITATEFKARCLKILDNLQPSGLTILKRGKPIAKVVPLPDRNTKELIGSMKGKIKIRGNIFRTGVKWNAES